MKKPFFLVAVTLISNVIFAQESQVFDSLTFKSNILKKEKAFALYLPKGYESSQRRSPVLYLLHGGSGNQNDWIQKGELQRIADKAIEEGKAAPMMRGLAFDKKETDNLFTQDEDAGLTQVVVERALTESGDRPFWKHFPEEGAYLFYRWSELDLNQLKAYVAEKLETDSDTVIELLKLLTPTIRSSASPKSFKSDLKAEQYQLLITVIGGEKIISAINDQYGEQELVNDEQVKWERMGQPLQSDLNIARQFMYWDGFG